MRLLQVLSLLSFWNLMSFSTEGFLGVFIAKELCKTVVVDKLDFEEVRLL